MLSATEQIDGLRGMVTTLQDQAALGQGQSNSLLKKLETAKTALDQGRLKVAYSMVGGFRSEVTSLVATGVLTPAKAGPLLSAADSLSQSLRTGGGF